MERNPVQGQGGRVICSGVSAHTGTALSVTPRKGPTAVKFGRGWWKEFPPESGKVSPAAPWSPVHGPTPPVCVQEGNAGDFFTYLFFPVSLVMLSHYLAEGILGGSVGLLVLVISGGTSSESHSRESERVRAGPADSI